MIPNLFNICQLFAIIGVTIIVALFLFPVVYNVHMSGLLHDRTSQNTSQVCQLNFSKSPKQNEHQSYLIKSGITECIRNQVKLFLSKS